MDRTREVVKFAEHVWCMEEPL